MTIYTNILYHSFHGDFLGCSVVKTGNHIAAHFDPILILFAPFFKLYPHPEFLSASQAIWLGSGIFPVYWLTRRALDSSWAGVVVAALFTLHPCLHAVILFEFHSLALVASPLLYALFFLESRYYRRFFVLLPFILFIREDVSLLMCFVGLSFILSNRNDAWVGALTILFSILYLVIVKLFLMNSPGLIMSGKDVYNYTSYFRYLIPHRGGLGDLILSILTNPIYAFKQMISMQKIEFVAVLLGPLLFIPLLSRKGLTMLLYGVIFLLLSSKAAVFNYKYHYQMVAFPVLIALVPFGLKRILETEWFGLHRKQMMIALLGTLFVASLLNGIMFGALAEKKSLYFLVNELSPKQQRVIKKVKDFVGMIEPEASVTASYNLGPFVASRMEVYSMNHYRPKTPTDYLFLDRKRTSDSALKKYDKQIKKGIFKKVAGYGSIVLYKHIPKKIRKKNVKKSKVRSRSVKKMIIE
ncbi:MAG: DUF2079 domain-containing protein [Proteobacteria bacterium]|nr:DUF2079 domain-containing protein [Pseudomonadota bacterium]